MSDIKISIYGACNRPHLWQWFYDNLSMNKTEFEIIFVGNVEPTFKMPDNFHFVYSNVKPAQCTHVAALMCTGDVIIPVADDCHYSPYALDILYDLYKIQNDYKSMVTPKFFGITETLSNEELNKVGKNTPINNPSGRIVDGDLNSLPLSAGGIMSKQFYDELGGPDTRFVFSFADIDIQIRAQLNGGKIIFCENAWLSERKDLCPDWINGKSKNYSGEDFKLYSHLWFANGVHSTATFTGKRFDEVQMYEENDTILLLSQGPKGEWN